MRLLHVLAIAPLSSAVIGSRHPLDDTPTRLFFDIVDDHSGRAVVRRGDPATDDVWDKAVCKGGTMMKQMLANDRDAGQLMTPPMQSVQSEFVGLWSYEMYRWGWKFQDYSKYEFGDDGLGIYDALSGLGMKADKLETYGRIWVHANEIKNEGKTYRATNGTYLSVIHPNGGALISLAKFSPEYMGRGMNPPVKGEDVVPFGKFSDIAFHQMAGFMDQANNPFDLKYVIFTPVENEPVLAVVARAIATTANQLEKWPGHSFAGNSTEALAILGTPYGTGVSFLLFQHKKQLGHKVVDKVTVFADSGKKTPRPPSLVFHIKMVQ